ncbi:MAG: hypothetical protein JWN40_1401 [Phycisphaerales bacterium]|nr:hypothetical protein [Phycisphaerales bacterium]
MAADLRIAHAFENLAQSLRVLLEAHARANFQGLLEVDRAEAIGNIETALSGVLNGFHSLYDAIDKQLAAQPIDWYRTPALATLLVIRNARHHNLANRIRTLYTYHAHEAEKPSDLVSYILVDFPSLEEDADTFEMYVSWHDLDKLLSLTAKESRIKPEIAAAIRGYLGSASFRDYAAKYALTETKVFINLTPLIVNAAAAILPHIQAFLKPLSTESKFFAEHFSTVEPARTSEHEVECGPFCLPN